MTPPPLLKLAFVKGPKDGESLEYKPGSTIRIGRVVRGNEIAIKDAGISTKHLRIVSDSSENWIIHDLGSSNGTILNEETLDPDIPVNLRHGDVIKLGECTSIVVNFETDVEAQEEHKLPPRPRRNNRRLPVADLDPDPVQEKPTRKGTRATRGKKVEDVADNEKEPEVKARVGRPRKKEAVLVEKKAQGGKNTEDVQDLGLNSIKLEIEDTPKEVKISEVKRGTRSRQIRNVKCEDIVLEEEKRRPSRATRSTKIEIGGDSFQELEMVLNQARKSRAKKKKTVEQKPSESVVEEMEARNDVVEEDKESENDVEEEKCCSVTSDKENEKVEQVETESRKKSAIVGEEDLNCSVRDDGEAENLQEEKDSKGEEAGVKTSDEQGSRNVDKVDLEKMTLGDWFKYMKVHLREQIVDETEKMIEDMTSKSLRVRQHIAEQKQAKGKGSES
ncbi:hypothetical protein N665_0299s0018 [Sinapis alba]|nr:hypothetical protein N665_0299s0018 [Sinapis alba]